MLQHYPNVTRTHHHRVKKNETIRTYSECTIITAYLVAYVAVILLDVLAFSAVVRQVWGLWKEKRRLGLHTNNDLVTLFVQQDCRNGLLICLPPSWLSDLFICEFILDLRRWNTTKSLFNLSALEFPDLSLSSQENPVRSTRSSIIANMGGLNDPVAVDNPDREEPNPETARVV
ncbi:hypothetical protein Clacol_004350 [Clathrus columnatus]|uniref:Uncharacterized protein n=1 Tax=Clathrus columnatus TaxID=1419009 RepID=A0AAV5A673_9AGAM|nr:hypothetical protein Clacol_004350 [Clathrus columnatus]